METQNTIVLSNIDIGNKKRCEQPELEHHSDRHSGTDRGDIRVSRCHTSNCTSNELTIAKKRMRPLGSYTAHSETCRQLIFVDCRRESLARCKSVGLLYFQSDKVQLGFLNHPPVPSPRHRNCHCNCPLEQLLSQLRFAKLPQTFLSNFGGGLNTPDTPARVVHLQLRAACARLLSRF